MKMTRLQALTKVTSVRDRIAALRVSSANSPRFQYWNEETLRLIQDLFPQHSQYEQDYRALSFGLLFDPHHRPGSHDPVETYRQSLDHAEGILNAMLAALGVEGSAPEGARLAVDPKAEPTEPRLVLLLHGLKDVLAPRIVPIAIEADLDPATLMVWPAEPGDVERRLRSEEKVVAALLAVGEYDLDEEKSPVELPEEILAAANTAVTVFGTDRVRLLVQCRQPLQRKGLAAQLLSLDARGQWRKALSKFLQESKAAAAASGEAAEPMEAPTGT